jgi:hypothetical protein
VRAAEQAWLELVHGSRAQDIAQGQAAADAAQAQQVVQGVNLQKLQLRARAMAWSMPCPTGRATRRRSARRWR